MSWIRRKINRVTNTSNSQSTGTVSPRLLDPSIVRYDVFKSHWSQVVDILSWTRKNAPFVKTGETSVNKKVTVTQDDVDAVRNLLEQMIYLLAEEQSSGLQLGPILEYVVTEGILDQLYQWYERSGSFKQQICINQIKVYEILISQAQHSLLHHKQLVNPMLKLLSSCSNMNSEEVDGHVVLLLNLLCVWINRDPTLLDLFFRLSNDQGPANFLIFSLLIDFIHREGSVGQQARDALLLCMTLSSEDERVAGYIISTNFCPVLATGLSGLYSSLPRQMDVRADEWHFLRKQDWCNVPSLINFMNSLEFCNSVVEAAGQLVRENLINYIYNGFLVSVLGPALHKSSANEVIVTTAYLNLFLQSVSAPSLMRCFLQFILCHSHDNALIINTLIQRIGSNSRLALVSLSLFHTLLDLNCEDLMLHLVFRYLIPCHHILASQRRSMCDTDMYSASALRFITLAPDCCVQMKKNENDIVLKKDEKDFSIFRPIKSQNSIPVEESTEPTKVGVGDVELSKSDRSSSNISKGDDVNTNLSLLEREISHSMTESPSSITADENLSKELGKLSEVENAVTEYTVNEDLSVTVNMHSENSSASSEHVPSIITSPNTMAEFGPDLQSQIALHTSYMDYLEDAKGTIDSCREACRSWSVPYDGDQPPDDTIVDNESSLNKPDAYGSAPNLLRNLEGEFKLCKPHAQSDPIHNLSLSSSESNQERLSSPALLALNATYQALNITAKALNNNPLTRSDECHQKNDSSVLITNNKAHLETDGNCKMNNTYRVNNHVPVESDNSNGAEECFNGEEEMKLQLTLHKVEEKNYLSIPNGNDIKNEKEFSPPATLSPIQSSSSVDEFFRALMEIVPKNARDNVEKPLTQTNESSDGISKKVSTRIDDDIESGIELSSNGGVTPSTPEDIEEQNFEIEEASDISDNGDTFGNEDSSLDNDDEDWEVEGDDTTSINSSSFYEAELEYVPTDLSLTPLTPLKMHSAPYTGPFLSTLFGKLDQMLSNSLYENLLLTGIVSRLACYPQPLLRSFLLNTHVVFHPAVRSLYQVLCGVKNRIDNYAAGDANFVILIYRAHKYLLARGTDTKDGEVVQGNLIQDTPMPVPRVKTKNTLLGEVFLRRRRRKMRFPKLDTLLENTSRKSPFSGRKSDKTKEGFSKIYKTSKDSSSNPDDDLRTKNAVYAAVLLAEFLKELAAISQEHAVGST